MKGNRHEPLKPRYDLMPPEALDAIGVVLAAGVSKHGVRNWESGMPYSVSFASLMRHLWTWWRGRDLDPETRLHHLAHAGCRLFFLLTYEARKMRKFDDRPKP